MASETESPLLFYRAGDSYGEFSNFSSHPIDIDGVSWPTTEHYFQAMKFQGTDNAERVRAAPGPGEAARLGRQLSPLRPDWETIKEDIMYIALHAKFTQHDELGRLLKETGTRRLVEHTGNDSYWADGGDGNGKNRLGVLLERLRDELNGVAV